MSQVILIIVIIIMSYPFIDSHLAKRIPRHFINYSTGKQESIKPPLKCSHPGLDEVAIEQNKAMVPNCFRQEVKRKASGEFREVECNYSK